MEHIIAVFPFYVKLLRRTLSWKCSYRTFVVFVPSCELSLPAGHLGTDTPSGDRHPVWGTDTSPRFPRRVLTGFTGFTGLHGKEGLTNGSLVGGAWNDNGIDRNGCRRGCCRLERHPPTRTLDEIRRGGYGRIGFRERRMGFDRDLKDSRPDMFRSRQRKALLRATEIQGTRLRSVRPEELVRV